MEREIVVNVERIEGGPPWAMIKLSISWPGGLDDELTVNLSMTEAADVLRQINDALQLAKSIAARARTRPT